MKLTRWESRTVLLLTTVLSCGLGLFFVYLNARRRSHTAGLSGFFLCVAAASVPLIACVAAWPRLSESFVGLGSSFADSLLQKTDWRRRSRSKRREEHRREMNRQLFDFATRHQALPTHRTVDRHP